MPGAEGEVGVSSPGGVFLAFLPPFKLLTRAIRPPPPLVFPSPSGDDPMASVVARCSNPLDICRGRVRRGLDGDAGSAAPFFLTEIVSGSLPNSEKRGSPSLGPLRGMGSGYLCEDNNTPSEFVNGERGLDSPLLRGPRLILRIRWASDFFRCIPPSAEWAACSASRFCMTVRAAGVPSRKVDVPKPKLSLPWSIDRLVGSNTGSSLRGAFGREGAGNK